MEHLITFENYQLKFLSQMFGNVSFIINLTMYLREHENLSDAWSRKQKQPFPTFIYYRKFDVRCLHAMKLIELKS